MHAALHEESKPLLTLTSVLFNNSAFLQPRFGISLAFDSAERIYKNSMNIFR